MFDELELWLTSKGSICSNYLLRSAMREDWPLHYIISVCEIKRPSRYVVEFVGESNSLNH